MLATACPLSPSHHHTHGTQLLTTPRGDEISQHKVRSVGFIMLDEAKGNVPSLQATIRWKIIERDECDILN